MMALQLQIFFLVLVVRGMAGALETSHISVMEGQTLIISCSIHDASFTHLEWKNPHGFVIFFNSHRGIRDKRYSLVNSSHSEYTFSLANVTFKDGGHYTCLQYAKSVTTKHFQVTVLGYPKLEMTEHEDRTAIKCSAEANYPPPRISWLFESGLQLDAPHAQYQCDGITNKFLTNKKCLSVDILRVKSHKRRVTVKCIVHHKALYNSHLMNFISIGKDTTEEEFSTTTVGYWSSTADTTEQATQSTTDPHSGNNNNITATVTTVSALTNTSSNPSSEDGQTKWDQQDNERQSAPLLIFLVTCLILGLLVVVIFFLIKLRRAHVIWKIENENSEQSLESSRSKSSNEEKLSQERKLQISVINPGYRNTNFTRYIAEEPPAEDATNAQSEETAQIQRDNPNPCVVTTSHQIKETEL
ncbi:cytotoxic and regulatory T-cell molecule [Conger conger]|uniref:cytotoxic and regulatory T-cell molecule n=1 Tax=Conger conger TaxID=82655 RepID=UPI002A5A2E92|nr:cytotoxic and regulatory T-cell molecule [Conger conger]